MKLAYLILAHSKPKQLGRLVGSLPPGSAIFVHFDRKSNLIQEALTEVKLVNPTVKFVKRHRCWWGSPGIMRATMELIRALISSKIDFDYATLLSGQDYPIKDAKYIDSTLSSRKEFIECFSLEERNRWTGQGPNFGSPDKLLGRFFWFRSRHIRVGTRKLPSGLKPYGGSQWWTLSRDALDYVSKTDPKLLRFFAHAFIPDETFVQTILGNSRFRLNMAQDDLRFAIWSRPKPPYPATLTAEDIPSLASSEKHFARKFDFELDEALPDMIDAMRSRLV